MKTTLRVGLLLAAGLLIAAKAPKEELATPLGSFQQLVSTDDYPLEALRNGKEGMVAYKPDIGPDGVPAKCTVTQSSGVPELDETTCTLMVARARFSPAKVRGKPAAGSYSGRFTWRIPQDDGGSAVGSRVPEPMDVVLDFDVLADGTVENCMALNAKSGEPMGSGCEGFRAKFDQPPRPVHVRVRNTVEVTPKDIPAKPTN